MSSVSPSTSTEAQGLFNATWSASMQSFNQVATFRHVAEQGLAAATQAVTSQMRDFVTAMFTDDEYKDLFNDREAAKAALGPVDKLALPMAENQIKTFRAAVDAASIVFCHSILDATAFDYCRVTALAGPSLWEDVVEKKQFALADIKDADYATLYNRKLAEHLAQFERESLLRKIDRLFALCQPDLAFAPIRDFTYDRGRIEALDKLRYDIVHGKILAATVTMTDADVFYYFSVGNYLMAIINRRFGLKIDPAAMLWAPK